MRTHRLHALLILIVLCLASGLVLAQDATPESTEAALAPDMATALVPCGTGVTGPCDLIATKPEDIVGVWKQYLLDSFFGAPGGMAYIRYNADGTYYLGDSVENTTKPYQNYPSGTFKFEGANFIINVAPGVPAPCDVPPVYQLRVLKYGDQPVALRYIPISDACTSRVTDLSQALIWVASGQ